MADAPPSAWQVQQWLNTEAPLSLAALRGKVVMLHAFQMLCPGCVNQALPQATQVYRSFDASQVAVIGLHAVFEHHAVMGVEALRVFLQEYRISYPVAVDQPAENGAPMPLTMQAYGLRGTPSLLLFDRQGRLRWHQFGQVSDLALGCQIGALLAADDADAVPGQT